MLCVNSEGGGKRENSTLQDSSDECPASGSMTWELPHLKLAAGFRGSYPDIGDGEMEVQRDLAVRSWDWG